jgi:hypothetical protein
MNLRTFAILTMASGIGVSCLAAVEGTRNRVWVLHEDEIVEYDISNRTVVNVVRVPGEISKNPTGLQITHAGEMLFAPGAAAGMDQESNPDDKAWIWNGRTASFLEYQLSDKEIPAGENLITTVKIRRRLSLSRDGRQLYWFENEFRVLHLAIGADQSVSTTFRVRQTDLSGRNSVQITSFAFPSCRCETGACSETCPEADFWFPDGGVDDFFIVTHYIPGQIGSTFQASFLYQKSQGKWSAHKLSGALEDVLDASQGGRTIIHRINDGGCCGWDNEGDDQTIMTTSGKNLVLFDERQRYSNADYDVSFFTSNARQSPDGSSIAATVVSTAKPGDKIRLASEGKENLRELARIRESIASLPAVEVYHAADPSKRLISLPNATLVGWLNNREILIIESGVLAAYDIPTNARTISDIKVSQEDSEFVR